MVEPNFTVLPPEPVSQEELSSDELSDAASPVPKGIRKYIGILSLNLQPSSIIGLKRIQKYSTWPMLLYFPLHSVNTLILPLIEPKSLPDKFLNTISEKIPSRILTSILLGSISIHLTSGIILRVSHWLYHKRQEKDDDIHSGRIARAKASGFRPFLQTEDTSQQAIGLSGGVLGYIIGFKKRFNHAPIVVSGYLLLPFLIYHLLILKYLPGTQIENNEKFQFIRWILQNTDKSIRWIGGIVPLAILVGSGTYHIGSGMVQYAGVKDLQRRRKMATAITLLISSGIIALARLARADRVLFINKHRFLDVFKSISFR
ncbi:Mcp1p NDAI_0E01350 [Naumovozyma dairenensis CBS 421]|uniref:Mitochondrial adapter protein MCP1 transmembrane domain-containing protein n=1 Tax=Naumovozyma dairenensis (strain ATCC 10597 / BCRC 20456 / CBS 421 / NBRC 0211 / NRRL Y-12639) TaxID=1071378 RepID=G0WB31_NAUDC|nr:hypothetical protein NDAI_0E01350 [Naumovozyma dairenensis CBS 421]CCD24951.1 hypothetical protein NDAI_0E01350 [Naumovozyma dairenensis CBS 421]